MLTGTSMKLKERL